MRLLGRINSINVRKAAWVAEEAGISYLREDWGRGFRPTSDPEFRALSLKGVIPVLVDGDFVLTESNAIMRYLARKAGRDDLYPHAPRAEAEVNEWLDWQASDLNAAWTYAVQGLVRASPAHQDPDAIRASLAAWHKQMQVLETTLTGKSANLGGDTFTIADIAIGLSINRWLRMPVAQPSLPAVEAYHARLLMRPLSPSYIGAGTD